MAALRFHKVSWRAACDGVFAVGLTSEFGNARIREQIGNEVIHSHNSRLDKAYVLVRLGIELAFILLG